MVFKWRNIYSDNLRVASLISGLKMDGILQWWLSQTRRDHCTYWWLWKVWCPCMYVELWGSLFLWSLCLSRPGHPSVRLGLSEQNLESDIPLCCGYLHKQCGLVVKTWRQRWFELRHDFCLYYFKREGVRYRYTSISIRFVLSIAHAPINALYGF